jgi:hypothetical protein
VLSQDTQRPPAKILNLTKAAIRATAVAIETDRRKRKRKIPKGRELIRLAARRYRSSIENGSDNHLGTADPRF